MKKIFLLIFAFVLLLTCSVMAEDTYVFLDEFDSDNWINKEGNVSVSDSKTIFEGNSASAELDLGGIDVSESGTITVEMKMKVISGGRLGKMPEFLGRTSDDGEPVQITLGNIPASGKFCIDGVSTGLTPVEGATYIFEYKLDLINNLAHLSVFDENGAEYTNSSAKNLKIGKTKLLWLDSIVFSSIKNNSMSCEVDYIKISDGSFKIMSLNVEENDVVPIDKDIIFKLNGEVDEATLNTISVMCGDESVEYEISKNENGEYVIYFPYGLSYNESYALTLPSDILSTGGLSLYERTVNFKTEMHPYYVKSISLSETDLEGKASVSLSGTFVNNTTKANEAVIIVLIYNKSGELVNSYYKPHTAVVGESNVEETIDLSDTENAKSAKIYVWNNLFGMNDVLIAE